MIIFDHRAKNLDLKCPFWSFDTNTHKLTPLILITKIALMLSKRKAGVEVGVVTILTDIFEDNHSSQPH